jgi:lysophospholipase L1-like esterase
VLGEPVRHRALALWHQRHLEQHHLDPVDPRRFSVILDALRAAKPGGHRPRRADHPNAACGTCGTSIPELNAAIAGWAATEGTAASPIYVVDQYTGFDPATDTGDGCHPNLVGSQKMAERWAEALAAHGLL